MLATGGCVNPIELEHLLDPQGWMVGGTTNPNLLTTRRPIGSTGSAKPHTAGTPSTKIRRRSSAVRRTLSACAYSGDAYHSRSFSIEGNSTTMMFFGGGGG